MKNNERRKAYISLGFTLVGIIAAVAPFALEADMFVWGGASFMGGVITAISAFITFLMFNGRAKVMSAMFSGDNILVKWRYSDEFWEKNIRYEIRDTKIMRKIGAILGGVFVIVGVVAFVIDPDDNGLFTLMMLGIGVFFLILGFVSAATQKRRLRRSPPEAVIAKEGVLYQGELFTWNQPAIAYLDGVSVNPADPSEMLFVIVQLSGRYAQYQKHYIHIPIPAGQEKMAEDIAYYFDKPIISDIKRKVRQ